MNSSLQCAGSYFRLLLVCLRLLHKGESLCCFRDSASVTYGGMFPSDLTLSALRFILSAKSGQSCKQDYETVDFCNSLPLYSGVTSFLSQQVATREICGGEAIGRRG